MPHPYPRRRRVASIVRNELAGALQIKFRSAMLTVLSVNLSDDLSIATISYSTLGNSKPEQLQEELDQSAPSLRTQLANNLNLRRVPKLVFVNATDEPTVS